MSGLRLRFMITANDGRHDLSQHTVATAAPATSSRGAPHSPKIRMGSMTMLMTAPISWVHMARVVRPVDCSSRSKQNWLKMPMERPRQIGGVLRAVFHDHPALPWPAPGRRAGRRTMPMRAKTTKLHRAQEDACVGSLVRHLLLLLTQRAGKQGVDAHGGARTPRRSSGSGGGTPGTRRSGRSH